MPKIKVSVCIKNQTEHEEIKIETYGIQSENRICYRDHGVQTILIQTGDVIYFKRIGKEFDLQWEFKESLTTYGFYDIKDINMKLKVEISTKNVLIKENFIEIEYEMILENDFPKIFCYQLKYEVI